jgi:hemolysin activation/secretion protein
MHRAPLKSITSSALALAALIGLCVPGARAQSPLRGGSTQPGLARQGVAGADPGARPAPPPLQRPAEGEAEAPAKKSVKSFRIARILFEGNTVIPTAELAELAKRYEHRAVTLAQLKELTASVRERYQRDGYLLARAAIPPQKLRPGGDVRVVVSEGLYGETKVENAKHYSEKFVARYFGRARRGGIVREAPLQRSLLLLNELPDLTVRSLFLPGDKPGTSDVVLRVQDRFPFHYGIDYNNYGNPLVGRNRAGLAVWLGNLVGYGDELTLRYTEPFPGDSDPLYQAGYSVPVGTDGNRLTYSYASAATQVSGDLAVLDIRGDAEVHALTLFRPMERTLERSTNANLGFVLKTVENFVLGNQRVSRDDLRLLTFGLDTNVVAGKTRTLASGLMSIGLGEAFNGDRQGNSESSRVGSGNEFTKWNLELFHVRQIGDGRFLLGRFSGQVATDPLTVSEQFALGGPDSVRGYLQSDYLGDNGYTTSIEYRQALYTSSKKTVNIQGAAFFDHGDANLQLPQIGEFESRSFTGAGIGRTTSIRVDVGFPLTDRNSQGKDQVLYAQTVTRW